MCTVVVILCVRALATVASCTASALQIDVSPGVCLRPLCYGFVLMLLCVATIALRLLSCFATTSAAAELLCYDFVTLRRPEGGSAHGRFAPAAGPWDAAEPAGRGTLREDAYEWRSVNEC